MAAVPGNDVFEAVARRGRSALAWEVLRRDPAYIAAHAAAAPANTMGEAANAAFAARWGLHFR